MKIIEPSIWENCPALPLGLPAPPGNTAWNRKKGGIAMRETLALMRVNLLGMLTSFSNNKQGKKKASGALIVLLMGGLSVYISVVYSLLLAQSLQPVGLLELLPIPHGGGGLRRFFDVCFYGEPAASCLAAGIWTCCFPLPVSAFSVMLSKLLALYLENLIFNVFLLIPAGVIYLVYGGEAGFCSVWP